MNQQPFYALKSSFQVKIITDILVILIDLDQGKSVTNDCWAVVRHLQDTLPGGIGRRKIYYRDTAGRFDQMLARDGRFAGFAPCSESQQKQFQELVTSRSLLSPKVLH